MGNCNVKKTPIMEFSNLTIYKNNISNTQKISIGIENEKEIKILIDKGHHCLFYSQKYPPEVLWCGQIKCSVTKAL